jgi:hypothetical protein
MVIESKLLHFNNTLLTKSLAKRESESILIDSAGHSIYIDDLIMVFARTNEI